MTKKQDFTKEFKELKREYDDIKDTLQRLQAEFQNFRKRTEDEKSKFVSYATQDMIQKILPVMDNFELALETKKEDTEFYKGVEMIYAQFKEILFEQGLTPIHAKGKFDPNIHEAVLVEDSKKENNSIIEELQKGYMLGNRVIRHSKVKIAKNGGKKNE